MNQYRVDRVNSEVVPCGMNSLAYIGDNYNKAINAYNAVEPGVDSWGQPNEQYGVLLSRYDLTKREYVPVASKGIG